MLPCGVPLSRLYSEDKVSPSLTLIFLFFRQIVFSFHSVDLAQVEEGLCDHVCVISLHSVQFPQC